MRARLKKLEKTDPQEASRIAQEQVQKVFKHLLKISGVTIEVNGLENIPDEASLFVGNHSSYFDIIVTGATIPGGVGFVAKDSLGKIPGLSSWMKCIHCLFLDRSDVRKGLQTILEGVDYLKEGYSMCIYPEGTRSTTGKLGEFKGGSLKMAQRAKAPVVPVAITGTRDIFENNPGLRVYPSHVTISLASHSSFLTFRRLRRNLLASMLRKLLRICWQLNSNKSHPDYYINLDAILKKRSKIMLTQ